MEGAKFDDFARALVFSRRGALRRLVTGLVGGAGGLIGAETAAQGCQAVGRRCGTDAECCSGLCDPVTGRCACPAGTEECDRDCLPLDQYQSDVENCGGCRVRCRQAPECQMPACLGGVCTTVPDPEQIEQPCGPLRGVFGVCAADGSCVCPPHLPTACGRGCVDTTTDPANCGVCDNRCPGTANGTAVCTGGVCGVACDTGYLFCGEDCCPDSRNCCDGLCCGPGECCRDGVCSVAACAPHCVIDGVWTADGAANSGNVCEICNSDLDQLNWSNAAGGTACGEPGQCCNLGVCQDCGCRIGEEGVARGALNPDNPCEACDPVLDSFSWSPLSDESCGEHRTCCAGICCGVGECCNLAGACVPCRCVIEGLTYEPGEINPAHDCEYCDPNRSTTEWMPAPDRTDCGSTPGRICCNGGCCSQTECCTPTGCEECGPICRIGEEDVPKDEVNPADPCQPCDPERRPTDWSEAPDDFVCGGELESERVCCRGLCCDPGECCDDGCKPCRCHIAGFDWDKDARNPLNNCEICNPDRDLENWSPGPPNSPCGLTNDRFCCAGECCPADECCSELGECVPCGCVIGGVPVPADAVNPPDTCQVCNPNRGRRDWTVLDDGEACGGLGDDRVCCGGTCCPQGQCCEGGACQDCGCEIGGDDSIAPETINPDKPCQICDPSRSRLSWSPVLGEVAWESDGAGVCCNGECCPENLCCLLDACGECLCAIGDDTVPPETTNPDNPCEVCKPKEDPFAWSPKDDDTACGDDRVCCAGTCCDPGLCCNLSVCQLCGCRIGEEEVAEFAINPENPCEWCDPVLDPLGWSPRSDEPCGDQQVCCGGICCERGQVCGLDDLCDSGPCEIEGVPRGAGTFNPDDPCEVCDPARDPSAWSPVLDNEPCGDGSGNVCCAGACCSSGTCCHAVTGVCGPEPCQCTIGDMTVNEGTGNPDNLCERCEPFTSTDAWTPGTDNTRCETVFDTKARYCCRGVCCPEDQCCRSDDTCGPCVCLIGDDEVESGQRNLDNDCEFCDPDVNMDGWTTKDHLVCGENLDQFCCAGACCPAGECCHSLEGACGSEPCGCEISVAGGTITYPEGTINSQNRCEVCDPAQSATGWSPRSDLEFCGGAPGPASGHCCEGVCCDNASENCCRSDGACDKCVCMIDGQEIAAAVANPANDCQVCIPYDNHTGWTTLDNGTGCGGDLAQVCCGGVCCEPNECCGAAGTCEPCDGDCTIDGVVYLDGTINPANECEACDPAVSTIDWSPAPEGARCEHNEALCCGGVCCGFNQVCGADGQCTGGEPGCTIESVDYPPQANNPANECEWCDVFANPGAWTPKPAYSPCGPNQDQFCCGGVCCATGECCTDENVCAVGGVSACDGCEIDGVFYHPFQPNPQSNCQYCDPGQSTAWSTLTDNTSCDEEGKRFCCRGMCCPMTTCCDATGVCAVAGNPRCEGCTIADEFFPRGYPNPENGCLWCSPEDSETGWSAMINLVSCGTDRDRNCCGGVCCEAGFCCTERIEGGQCVPCP